MLSALVTETGKLFQMYLSIYLNRNEYNLWNGLLLCQVGR